MTSRQPMRSTMAGGLAALIATATLAGGAAAQAPAFDAWSGEPDAPADVAAACHDRGARVIRPSTDGLFVCDLGLPIPVLEAFMPAPFFDAGAEITRGFLVPNRSPGHIGLDGTPIAAADAPFASPAALLVLDLLVGTDFGADLAGSVAVTAGPATSEGGTMQTFVFLWGDPTMPLAGNVSVALAGDAGGLGPTTFERLFDPGSGGTFVAFGGVSGDTLIATGGLRGDPIEPLYVADEGFAGLLFDGGVDRLRSVRGEAFGFEDGPPILDIIESPLAGGVSEVPLDGTFSPYFDAIRVDVRRGGRDHRVAFRFDHLDLPDGSVPTALTIPLGTNPARRLRSTTVELACSDGTCSGEARVRSRGRPQLYLGDASLMGVDPASGAAFEESFALVTRNLVLDGRRRRTGALADWPPRPMVPPDAADLDDDGMVTIADFITFVERFQASDPAADLDGDEGISDDDIRLAARTYLFPTHAPAA